jgi:hypothetical protein
MSGMHKMLLLVAVIATVPLVAQSPKEPWMLTLEERIALRTDDAAAAARLRIYRASQPPAVTYEVDGTASDPYATCYDRIDGRRDPHLFFPSELFDSLARMAYAEEFETRLAYRESKEDDLRAIGLPADFWETMEVITAAYRADRNDAQHYALSQRPEAEKHAAKEVAYKRMCRDRRVALREAEERFGAKFTQFLYTAVAPNISSLILHKTDPQEMRRILTGECE